MVGNSLLGRLMDFSPPPVENITPLLAS